MSAFGAVLLAVVLLAALVLGAALVHLVKHHGAGPVAWRWFSGHPLDGRHRTNATWNHRATRVLHPTGRVVGWHHMRRRTRAIIRSGATVLAVAMAWALSAHPFATLLVLAGLAVTALALAAPRGVLKARNWRHYRTWVRPLDKALTHALAVPPVRLAIEHDRSKVQIWLPEEFTGEQRERDAITRSVTEKLAIEGPEASWSLSRKNGGRPMVTFTQSEPPPARVPLAAIMDHIRAAAEHEIVMGIGRRGGVVKISVDNDSPHLGLSMGSGDGKSTVAKNQAAQLLYHGALLMVLDIKLISHMWARYLPNVSYAGRPDEIEAALCWLAGEVSRRNRVALAAADIEGRVNANVGPRIFVIAEELNATQNRLKAWWQRDMEMKGRSPGSEALDEVMFLGRQVLCNVEQIGQRLSVKASGSGDARENMGVLIFKDPSASAWKMLVGDRHPMPPATGHLGRLQVVTSKAVQETQGAFMTGQEAHDLALSGTVAVPPANMPCVMTMGAVPAAAQISDSRADQQFVVGQAPVVSGPPASVTLREAVDAGLFRTIDAARKAAQRPGFPAVVGERDRANLYDIGDLAAFRSGKVKVLR